MSTPGGELATAISKPPPGAPAGAASVFHIDWPSGKPGNNA
jgi:hypothetical protein